MAKIPITVIERNVKDYLQVNLYHDGSLQVSIDDEVLVHAELPTPANTDSAREALRRMLSELAEILPLQIEGRDFGLGYPTTTS